MRITPLSPPGSSTYRNILKWFNKLGLKIYGKPEEINKIVLIGNGTPDDIVITLLLHKLNGHRSLIVGVTKSQNLRVEIIKTIANLIQLGGRGINCILGVIDQEDEELGEIWERLNARLNEYSLKCEQSNYSDKLKSLRCLKDGKEFTLIIAINGIHQRNYRKHTIEDHLLEIAKDIFGREHIEKILRDNDNDPKKTCFSMKKEDQKKVYEKILNETPEHLRNYLEQQYDGIKLLERC